MSETMYDKDTQLEDTRDETSIRSSDPKLKTWLTITGGAPTPCDALLKTNLQAKRSNIFTCHLGGEGALHFVP